MLPSVSCLASRGSKSHSHNGADDDKYAATDSAKNHELDLSVFDHVVLKVFLAVEAHLELLLVRATLSLDDLSLHVLVVLAVPFLAPACSLRAARRILPRAGLGADVEAVCKVALQFGIHGFLERVGLDDDGLWPAHHLLHWLLHHHSWLRLHHTWLLLHHHRLRLHHMWLLLHHL